MSEECEKKVLKTCKFIEKNIRSYVAGSIVATAIIISGFVAPVNGKIVVGRIVIGMLTLGIIFIFFPFVTPQTVKIFGLRKGMISGRIGGIILLLLGLILLFKIV